MSKDRAVRQLPLPIFFINIACLPTPFAGLFGHEQIKHNQKGSQKGDRREHVRASGIKDLKILDSKELI